MPKKVQLRVIPTPNERERSIFKLDPSDQSENTIVFQGDGEIEYICGACRAVLVKGMENLNLRSLVFHCRACDSYNDVFDL